MERRELSFRGSSKGAKKHIRLTLAQARKEEALKPDKVKLPDRYTEVQQRLQRPDLNPQDRAELQFEDLLWGLKLQGANPLTIKEKGMEFYDKLSAESPSVYKALTEASHPGPNNRIVSRAVLIHNLVFPPKQK